MGYYPDLKNPHSFNEKVTWKKFHDRNPHLPIISDKYGVRDYINNELGKKKAEEILVPLFHVTENPDSIPFDAISSEYILKANHASSRHIISEISDCQRKYTIIEDNKIISLTDSEETRKKIIDTCKNWLSRTYGFFEYEWSYQKIKRKIIVEKLLRDKNGRLPTDFKFKVFHGKCELIQVIYDRYIDVNRAWYTPNWKYVDIGGGTSLSGYKKKPKNLESMLKLAELLGRPFDFIRVDLYSVDDKIYFGELTNYPMSGITPFNPVSFDFELGSKWKIRPKYWSN